MYTAAKKHHLYFPEKSPTTSRNFLRRKTAVLYQLPRRKAAAAVVIADTGGRLYVEFRELLRSEN
jgi:hypothetical protein